MSDKGNKLFGSHEKIKEALDELIDDVPDLEGTNFYTLADGWLKGWRDALTPETKSYLSGFKQGLETAKQRAVDSGGTTLWGALYLGCPYTIIEQAERMKEVPGKEIGGTHCDCDKCKADQKAAGDYWPSPKEEYEKRKAAENDKD